MKKIILYVIIALLNIFSVMAYSVHNISAPAGNYSTSRTLTVNISGGINASGVAALTNAYEIINVTILNHSGSSSDAYGILASSISLLLNASNASIDVFWNFTATFAKGYTWIRLNFTNATSGGILSDERLINIDVEYDTVNVLGANTINLSTGPGNISISGTFRADGDLLIAGDKIVFGNESNLSVEMAIPTGLIVKAGNHTGSILNASKTPTLYYKVTALDGAGGETAASAEISATITINQTNATNISWSPVRGALSYRVYNASSSDGEASYFDVNTSLNFTHHGQVFNGEGTPPTDTTAYVIKASSSGNSWILGGNVGINISAPTKMLHVLGQGNVSGNFYTQGIITAEATTTTCAPNEIRGNNSGAAGSEICLCNSTGNWRCIAVT